MGLVLAAGAGRRFGGPKALVTHPQSGRSLVEEAVSRVVSAGVDTVVVVTGAAHREVEAVLLGGVWPRLRPSHQDVRVEIAHCADWPEGMGASLRHGLDVMTEVEPGAAAVIVALVDLPDVTSEVIARVCRAAVTTPAGLPAALVRAAYGGVPGHPVLMGRNHVPGVRAAASGDSGARGYLAEREVLLVECGDLATGRDVDHPGDLREVDDGTHER